MGISYKKIAYTIFSVGLVAFAFFMVRSWQHKEAAALLARLPAGEGRREFVQSCSGCHNLERVLAVAPRSAAEWQQTILWMEKMQGMGKLPAPTEAKIVDYLSREFGTTPALSEEEGLGQSQEKPQKEQPEERP